ncbi:hypothetical protein BC830DRAFT_1136649 [Chytriomyces sp. MP71]|nr:hypothetical protein BC830DRAFT_1136649 [Chytriomyces sp. MP71]
MLLVFVPGFMGDSTSFGSFPNDVARTLRDSQGLDVSINIEVKIAPPFDSTRTNMEAVEGLAEWLLANASAEEYTNVAVAAHSMGGLVAADALRLLEERSVTTGIPMPNVTLLFAFDSPFYGIGAGLVVEGPTNLTSTLIEQLPDTETTSAAIDSATLAITAASKTVSDGVATLSQHTYEQGRLLSHRASTILSASSAQTLTAFASLQESASTTTSNLIEHSKVVMASGTESSKLAFQSLSNSSAQAFEQASTTVKETITPAISDALATSKAYVDAGVKTAYESAANAYESLPGSPRTKALAFGAVGVVAGGSLLAAATYGLVAATSASTAAAAVASGSVAKGSLVASAGGAAAAIAAGGSVAAVEGAAVAAGAASVAGGSAAASIAGVAGAASAAGVSGTAAAIVTGGTLVAAESAAISGAVAGLAGAASASTVGAIAAGGTIAAMDGAAIASGVAGASVLVTGGGLAAMEGTALAGGIASVVGTSGVVAGGSGASAAVAAIGSATAAGTGAMVAAGSSTVTTGAALTAIAGTNAAIVGSSAAAMAASTGAGAVITAGASTATVGGTIAASGAVITGSTIAALETATIASGLASTVATGANVMSGTFVALESAAAAGVGVGIAGSVGAATSGAAALSSGAVAAGSGIATGLAGGVVVTSTGSAIVGAVAGATGASSAVIGGATAAVAGGGAALASGSVFALEGAAFGASVASGAIGGLEGAAAVGIGTSLVTGSAAAAGSSAILTSNAAAAGIAGGSTAVLGTALAGGAAVGNALVRAGSATVGAAEVDGALGAASLVIRSGSRGLTALATSIGALGAAAVSLATPKERQTDNDSFRVLPLRSTSRVIVYESDSETESLPPTPPSFQKSRQTEVGLTANLLHRRLLQLKEAGDNATSVRSEKEIEPSELSDDDLLRRIVSDEFLSGNTTLGEPSVPQLTGKGVRRVSSISELDVMRTATLTLAGAALAVGAAGLYYYSGGLIELATPLAVGYAIKHTQEASKHLQFLYPLWGETRADCDQRMGYLMERMERGNIHFRCFIVELPPAKDFKKDPPQGIPPTLPRPSEKTPARPSSSLSLRTAPRVMTPLLAKRTFIASPPDSVRSLFIPVACDGPDVIYAHMHMLKRQMNGGAYSFLVEETAKAIHACLRGRDA